MRGTLALVGIAALALAGCADEPPPPARPPIAACPACPPPPPVPTPFRIRVELGAGASTAPVSGRLFVFLAPNDHPRGELRFDFGDPKKTWFAAEEVDALAPGSRVELDLERASYPDAIWKLPEGDYQVMALIDVGHQFPRTTSASAGDYRSAVVVRHVAPLAGGVVDVLLDTRIASRPAEAEGELVKAIHVPSALLSAFHGRPVEMSATVVLPPSASDPKKRFPTEYRISGFGGTEDRLLKLGAQIERGMRDKTVPEIAFVLLSGIVPGGHSAYADSVNDGPWGRALVEELVPALEKRFPLVAKPQARFLAGHSSGGWASLWLQIHYPDAFGGTWSTSPDPVDFRDFLAGADATPGSHDNLFRQRDGAPRAFWHVGDRVMMTVEEFARLERASGEYGGVVQTFEWVFSPRADDGRPMKLFDRVTGEQDPVVQHAWEAFDVRKVLAASWPKVGKRLQGKLHLACGDQDEFYLDRALHRLCAFLVEQGSDARCEFVPGRGHLDFYGKDLVAKDGPFAKQVAEMKAAFERRR